MTRKTVTIVQYNNGYSYYCPEDDWEDDYEVHDAMTLFKAFKAFMKRNRITFNDSSIVGLFCTDKVEFVQKKVIIDDDGTVYTSEEIEIDKPSYYDEAVTLYKEYVDYLKKRYPRFLERKSSLDRLEEKYREIERLKKAIQNLEDA